MNCRTRMKWFQLFILFSFPFAPFRSVPFHSILFYSIGDLLKCKTRRVGAKFNSLIELLGCLRSFRFGYGVYANWFYDCPFSNYKDARLSGRAALRETRSFVYRRRYVPYLPYTYVHTYVRTYVGALPEGSNTCPSIPTYVIINRYRNYNRRSSIVLPTFY